MTRYRPLAAAAALVLGASLLSPAAAAAKPTITMSGSTTVAPLAALLAKKYLSACGHCVNFKLLQGGSDIGVADVAAGRVTIGNSSRDPKPSDPGGLVFNKIAHDAVCIVTNDANPIPGIDQAGVQAIFGGGVRTWSSVPGATQRGTIDVVVRTPGSGTQDAFQQIFMGSTKVFGGASQKTSNGLVQQLVKSDPFGVGYVSLYFTERPPHDPLQGRRLHAAQREVRPVRRRAQPLHGHPRRPQGPGQGVDQLDHAQQRGRSIIGTEWVPLH